MTGLGDQLGRYLNENQNQNQGQNENQNQNQNQNQYQTKDDDDFWDDDFFDYTITTSSPPHSYLFELATLALLATLLLLLLPAVKCMRVIRKRRKKAKARKTPSTFEPPDLSHLDAEEPQKSRDWQALPRKAKIAAESLGYGQNTWDNDIVPDLVRDMNWDDLHKTQQVAALLGEDWDDIIAKSDAAMRSRAEERGEKYEGDEAPINPTASQSSTSKGAPLASTLSGQEPVEVISIPDTASTLSGEEPIEVISVPDTAGATMTEDGKKSKKKKFSQFFKWKKPPRPPAKSKKQGSDDKKAPLLNTKQKQDDKAQGVPNLQTNTQTAEGGDKAASNKEGSSPGDNDAAITEQFLDSILNLKGGGGPENAGGATSMLRTGSLNLPRASSMSRTTSLKRAVSLKRPASLSRTISLKRGSSMPQAIPSLRTRRAKREAASKWPEEDTLATPLLPDRACYQCYDADESPEVADLLDTMDDTDEVCDRVSHVKKDGTSDELVPIFATSVLQVRRGGLGGRKSMVLGSNKKVSIGGNADTTAFDYLLDEDLNDSSDAPPKGLGYDEEDEGDLPNYDDYDWDDLPRNARVAAEELGYTKKMWDEDQDSFIVNEVDWEDLTVVQRAAALELGWNERIWDGLDEDGEPIDETDYFLSNVITEVGKGWRMAKTVLSYDTQSRRIMRLAIPSTIGSISEPLLDGIMTALFVTHMGPAKYLAWVMVDFFLGITESLLDGFAETEALLTAQAIGMQKYFLAGQYVQLTIVLDFMISIPAYAIWVAFIGDVLIGFDFGQDVAAYAVAYVPYSAAARMIEGSIGDGLDRLMWNEQRGGTMTTIDIISDVLYLGAFLLMIFSFDCSSLAVLGALDLGFAVASTSFTYWVCKRNGWIQKYERGLYGQLAIENWALTKGVLKMSVPLTIGHLLYNSEWQILTFFAAHMGAAETAAWTIAESLWELLETLPEGFSDAGEILMCKYLGSGRSDLAKIVAYKIMLYGFLAGVVSTGIFWCFRKEIVFYFTEEDTLFALLYELVTLLCIGNVVMTLGNCAYTVLESQGRIKITVVIYAVTVGVVTLPLSTWFVFDLGYGLDSILFSCVAGYCLMSFGMLLVVFTSNWPKMSRKTILRAAKHDKDLEDMLDRGAAMSEKPRPLKRVFTGELV